MVEPEKPDNDEMYTPQKVFAPLQSEFQFQLDPCCTHESAKAERYYTKAENGLWMPWYLWRVFLNPPYSNIGVWLEKSLQEREIGCPLVVALLPSWTDRVWWHEYIEPDRRAGRAEVRFLRGRPVYGVPGDPEALLPDPRTGKKRGAGKFPNVLIIWRAKNLVIPDPRQVALFG